MRTGHDMAMMRGERYCCAAVFQAPRAKFAVAKGAIQGKASVKIDEWSPAARTQQVQEVFDNIPAVTLESG